MSKHHIFGVRHHGPGSARALFQALDELKPDIILIEGPPDGNDLLPWLGHSDLEPPVALLIYRPDKPESSGYFPYAVFSPEFQAARYGLMQGIPVRFMDLPQAHIMATDAKPLAPTAQALQELARAAGHQNYESWWNLFIEQRQDSRDIFPAILELMTAARETAAPQQPAPEFHESVLWAERREAYMRQTMRWAANEHECIAVVCGAWHAPALRDLSAAAADEALLDDLPQVDVEAAWVPWTYGRLSYTSGYGAGIRSPGWYHHLWQMGRQNAAPTELSIAWLSRVAELLRGQGLDASAAHVIEAVRLAETLAAMRGLPFPGLPELNEATQTVLCFGDDTPMKLIQKKLIVGERMGAVPPDTPMVPLQRDLQRQQRLLKLFPEATPSALNLDLREERDLQCSHLLHRLNLLSIPWGQSQRVRGKRGTYQEAWQLHWLPDFAVRVIEANMWGNTVQAAAAGFAQDAAQHAADLPALTKLLDAVILAELPEVIAHIMQRIDDEAASSSDVVHMMGALPPLARVLRYGNVRQTDQEMVRHVVNGLLTRICIGLPSTCASLDDDAAQEMAGLVTAVNGVVTTLRNAEHSDAWHETMQTLVNQKNVHGLLAGRACRFLLDDGILQRSDAAIHMERALSLSLHATQADNRLNQSAAWLEGFLQGSELLLIHDQNLWQLLDRWLSQLDNERFQGILPLLRRTFSGFSEAARQQMHERVRTGAAAGGTAVSKTPRFDQGRAETVLPILAEILGLE